MLIKIFSTTVLLVVSWLTVAGTHILDDMKVFKTDVAQLQSSLNQSQVDFKKSTQAACKSINDNLDGYIAVQEKNAGLAKELDLENKNLQSKIKKKDGELKGVKNQFSLNTAYSAVLQAEIFSLRKNGEAAANTLLSTKSAIYKAGGTYPKHKDSLRKLMGPIDVLAAKWKKGDFSKTSLEIRKTLKEVIKKIST